jgi:peptidoglycan/xylan/chitin deacetylase (PgdA/CDA1 family)
MPRIVVFSGDLSYSVRKGIAAIDDAIPGIEWLVLLHSPRKPLARLLRSQWRNLRRNGWRWIPYQAGDVLRRCFPRSAAPVARDRPGGAYTSDALRARANVRVLEVNDIHAADASAAAREFQPDLGLSLAAPILRPSIFGIPRLGTLNLHKGRVPDYRGMPPAFWELWNDEPSVGCTVHWVAEKLDYGDAVREATVARRPHSNVQGLQLTLDEVGVSLMREAVQAVLAGTANARPQGPNGKTYRKPTLAQVATLERKLAPPKQGIGGVVKGAAKSAVLASLRAAKAVGLRGAPRITVLLYHRVTDDVRDNLTVGVAQFNRQMALLREHCQIVSIEDMLASPTIRASKRPLVAVTFDDGYLDNYEHAAPILERNGIPAAFFVSTGIVNSDNRFPHDIRRENPPIPVMTWEQLREMRARGFTIGSHSVYHIDCAAEPEARVKQELAQSRDDLARELGVREVMFAYPYGGRRHMTPERLELVKQAGYIACLSAYGGTNVREVDRFNILRRGIHWGFDDAAFLLECQGVTRTAGNPR